MWNLQSVRTSSIRSYSRSICYWRGLSVSLGHCFLMSYLHHAPSAPLSMPPVTSSPSQQAPLSQRAHDSRHLFYSSLSVQAFSESVSTLPQHLSKGLMKWVESSISVNGRVCPILSVHGRTTVSYQLSLKTRLTRLLDATTQTASPAGQTRSSRTDQSSES